MSDTLIVLHTAIAIIAIVLLILVVRIDPVISLFSAEVVDGAVQRQPVALLDPLLGGDLRLRAG